MPAEAITASVHIDAPARAGVRVLHPARGDHLLDGRLRAARSRARRPVRPRYQRSAGPGRFLELDPPRRLLISWGYAGSGHLPPGASTVEVRLTADRGGTRVELQHRDLPPDERPGHASGWTHYLARLRIAAALAAIPAPIPACRRPRPRMAHGNARPGTPRKGEATRRRTRLRAASAVGQCRRDGDRAGLRARRAEPARRCPAPAASICTRRLRALCQRTVAGAGRHVAHHDVHRGTGPVRVMGGSHRGDRDLVGGMPSDPRLGRCCRRGARSGPAHRHRQATLVVS